MKKQFSVQLLDWDSRQNHRAMPWKGEKDPYRIWLSEIILQQTRVEQGWAYYLRFIEKYPNVNSLANAPEPEVMKLWEGLGYYSRCRNLIASAKMIATDFKGVFPNTYDSLLKLKGVGGYTAAAIASFGFGLPHAVVDGNVQRVLARVFGIEDAIDSTLGKKLFEQLANELLEKNEPARYNQAIMDFGATVCKPQLPSCSNCPFSDDCIALQKGIVDQLPVKSKKMKVRERFFTYHFLECKKSVFVRVRNEKDIWQDLNEFVLQESEQEFTMEGATNFLEGWLGDNEYVMTSVLKQKPHKLTHQTIHITLVRIKLEKELPEVNGYKWVTVSQLKKLAFPKALHEFTQADFFQ
jgi:A/G-specific adenine glycosylase